MSLTANRGKAEDMRRNTSVLWRMNSEKAFLDDVAEQLLEIAKSTAPIIDRLVKENTGNQNKRPHEKQNGLKMQEEKLESRRGSREREPRIRLFLN